MPSDNAATDILGLLKRRIRIVVRGVGINLKKSQNRFWTFRESLSGKHNSKSGGVPIAIQEAKKVIRTVDEINLIRGSALIAENISRNDGKGKYENFIG